MTAAANQVFLGETLQIPSAHDDVVLLHAPFDAGAFDQDLFAQLDVNFPDSLRAAIAKRRADFLAGRALVNRGFDALNLPRTTVAIGSDRAPVWPAGVVGSLSHTRKSCACILSRNTNLRLGIDIETDLSAQGDRAVRKIALRDSERELIGDQAQALHHSAVIFSAKETLFKALYPIVREIFGFDCAEIRALPEAESLRLYLTKELHPSLPKDAYFDIRTLRMPTQILTWLICEV